jgi:hypothetical protein
VVKVTLKGVEHEVVLPRFADRRDLVYAMHNHGLRGSAAAIGRCVPSLTVERENPKTGKAEQVPLVQLEFKAFGYDALEYGAAVWEQLAAHRIRDREIVLAGRVLLAALSDGLFPSDVEVDAAEGFSSPSAGGSTT